MKSKTDKVEIFTRRQIEKHFNTAASRKPHGQYGHSDHYFYTVPTMDNKELLVANDTRELIIKLMIYHGVQTADETLELVSTILRRI